MKLYKVLDTERGESFTLTALEVLEWVNAERSSQWSDYTMEDLEDTPADVFQWMPEELEFTTEGESK
jgi:hypothetical protein